MSERNTSAPSSAPDAGWLGYAQVAGAASSWGLWSLFFKPAERIAPIHPALEGTLLFLVVSLTMGGLALRDRPLASRPKSAWWLMGLLGVSDALNILFFFWSMQRTSIAVAVLSHYLAPVLVAVASPLLFRERTRPSLFGFLGMALLGLLLLLEPWKAGGATLMGAGLGAASAVFYAANILLQKKLVRWFSPLEVLGYHSLPSAAVIACFVPLDRYHISPGALGLVSVGALLLSGCGGLLFMRGIAKVSASRAAVLTLLEPLVAVTAAALVWGETPGPLAALGAALLLGAAYGVVRG